MREEFHGISPHDGEGEERLIFPFFEDLDVLFRGFVVSAVREVRLDGGRDGEVQLPDAHVYSEAACKCEYGQPGHLLYARVEGDEQGGDEEDHNKPQHFGGEHEPKVYSEEESAGVEEAGMVFPPEHQQKEQHHCDAEEEHGGVQHGSSVMDDESVVEHVEKTQHRRIQPILHEEQEDPEHEGGGKPAEKHRKEAKSPEGEIWRDAPVVVGMNCLVIQCVCVDQNFSQGNEHFPQRGVRFHEEDAVHVFLRAGYVVIFIPEIARRCSVVVDVREIREEEDESCEQKPFPQRGLLL